MKSPKTFLLLSVIVAVLLLGVAYAAISNITMTVTGNVVATPSDANFDVSFDESVTPSKSGVGTVEVAYADDLNANVKVTGFTKKGDSATVVFTITNYSEDLAATLVDSHTTPDKFTVTTALDATRLESGESCTLTVTVTLDETPITENIACDFSVNVVATPSNPS